MLSGIYVHMFSDMNVCRIDACMLSAYDVCMLPGIDIFMLSDIDICMLFAMDVCIGRSKKTQEYIGFCLISRQQSIGFFQALLVEQGLTA